MAKGLWPLSRNPSLLFELEDDDSNNAAGRHEHAESGTPGAAKDVAALLVSCNASLHQLRVDVREAPQGVRDASQLARHLSSIGYPALLRTAIGSAPIKSARRNESALHSFVLCAMPGCLEFQFLVDPRFRELFEIAMPTSRYSAVLAAVPPVFVGTQACLSALVMLLCDEMREAFAENKALLPPWRQTASMLSRWQARRFVDQQIVVGGGGTLGLLFGDSNPFVTATGMRSCASSTLCAVKSLAGRSSTSGRQCQQDAGRPSFQQFRGFAMNA